MNLSDVLQLADPPRDFSPLGISRAWLRRQVETFPRAWQDELRAEWEQRAASDERAANLAALDVIERLRGARLPLDATDGDVTAAADRCAAEALGVYACATPGQLPDELALRNPRRWPWPCSRRMAVERFCIARGVVPPSDRINDGPALARMFCPQWWRRQLRAQHARAVEGAAISLGRVSLKRERYCSDETLRRRVQQNRRNADTLARTIAENDEGQQFSLAELAARSTANKDIRRGELVTRLKGFEAIARELGHGAVFVTLTAPSRFHAMLRNGARNPKHDGSTPAEGQAHLCRTWARIRAKLAREAVPVYGFRIAEPHGDGCPHWHLILFYRTPAELAVLWSVIRAYALAEDGDEAGAAQHRAKFERIDFERGSAVGYVIKYIAKNIDGFRVGEWKIDGDLLGDESLNLSPRVEAWAATWRIRQFQQIGGPPVGLWRELRRVPREHLIDAPDTARDAWLAAQRLADPRVTDPETGELIFVKRADWGGFVTAAGGPVARRAARPLQLAKKPDERLTRYGEQAPDRPAGITARGFVYYTGQGLAALSGLLYRTRTALVASVRRAWRVIGATVSAARRAAPRTCVNNCTNTPGAEAPSSGGCRMPAGGGERDPARGRSPPHVGGG